MTISEYNNCVNSFSDNIYRFILKNLGDCESSNDIVQDTFMKLWLKRKDVNFKKAKSYLFTSAYHTMIDHIRKISEAQQWRKRIMQDKVVIMITLI